MNVISIANSNDNVNSSSLFSQQLDHRYQIRSYSSLELTRASAGFKASIAMIMATSTATSNPVTAISDHVDTQRGFRVMIFFLPLARIRAILLVFISTDPYIIENARPGSILARWHETIDGFTTKNIVDLKIAM